MDVKDIGMVSFSCSGNQFHAYHQCCIVVGHKKTASFMRRFFLWEFNRKLLFIVLRK